MRVEGGGVEEVASILSVCDKFFVAIEVGERASWKEEIFAVVRNDR